MKFSKLFPFSDFFEASSRKEVSHPSPRVAICRNRDDASRGRRRRRPAPDAAELPRGAPPERHAAAGRPAADVEAQRPLGVWEHGFVNGFERFVFLVWQIIDVQLDFCKTVSLELSKSLHILIYLVDFEKNVAERV